ncbi:TNF receptor-associated factor family protein DDB_G0272098 [Anoplophora glabripennis]|uniref:Midasin n=1 Tax=Anoplophora glabripennis TaxID=217634 RepID=V5GAI2_ANOGL|nr:TNF receptor-associated factor family protein DDB_G0272098 [Anoplophora glabripennis]
MSKIIIILLLITGVFSLLDDDGTEKIKQDEVNDDELAKAAASSEADTSNEKAVTEENKETVKSKPKTKKAPVLLDKQQINMLAEKVIRIHGVEPESDDEENQKNIDSLRQLVANVEKNLNEKLKLSQASKTNLNAENPVTGSQSAPSQTAQNQNNNEGPNDNENLEQNVNAVSNAKEKSNAEGSEEIGRETNVHDQAEKKTTNENLDTQSNTETGTDAANEKSESAVEENEKTSKTQEVKVSGKESDEKEQQVNADAGIVESNIENSEDVSGASATENGRSETGIMNSEEENEDTNEHIATEMSSSDLQSINENIKVETSPAEDTDSINPDDKVDENITEKPEDNKFENNDIDDIHAETNGSEYVRSEVEKDNKVEDTVVEDIKENVAEYEAAQNGINDDRNETSYTQSDENDESNEKNTEDEISGACSLNDECDQADTTKIHVYSEAYNSETVTEERLETKTEDSHFQRIIKFVTSIF